MARVVGREELKAKLDRGENFVLIEVLGPEDYARGHIPGAINIPVEHIAHEAKARFKPGQEIVLYCANLTCKASTVAARKLEQIWFHNVWEYAGGKQDWQEAGYPMAYGPERE